MKLTPSLGGAYSGSFGGVTASHNKGGQYFRRRSVPTNPNTLRQQLTRSTMGSLAQTWAETLTEAQRQAWRDYAANTPVTDSLGQTMTLSGFNFFARGNSTRQYASSQIGGGIVTIEDAPVIFDTGSPPISVDTFEGIFSLPPGTVEIAGSIAPVAPDDGDVYVFVAGPQTPGTRYYKGPYQLAVVIPIASGATSFDSLAVALGDSAAWRSSTIPVAGWDTLQIPIRVAIGYDDGRYSQQWMGLVPFVDATP